MYNGQAINDLLVHVFNLHLMMHQATEYGNDYLKYARRRMTQRPLLLNRSIIFQHFSSLNSILCRCVDDLRGLHTTKICRAIIMVTT